MSIGTMRFAPVARSISKLLDLHSVKLMDRYCVYNPSPVTLKQLVDFGRTATEEESFLFVKKEVPVRLANIMKEINLLPSNLLQMPSVILIQEMYAKSFVELCSFEGRSTDRQTLRDFVDVLGAIRARHEDAVQLLARGVLELKETHVVDPATENRIQYFLDRFYMSRISTRMLTNQHSMLFGPDAEYSGEEGSSVVGMIDTRCRVKSVVGSAYDAAGIICEQFYHVYPELSVTEVNSVDPDKPIEIVYPPMHLRHILFELLKNAMRATVEYKRPGGCGEVPEIQVQIAKGEHDVTVKISDQGGGIPRDINDNLFHYLFSTAPRPSMDSPRTPLAGYGFGLPLSRLYARYFHGDLSLTGFEGYGTDAVVFLKTRPEDKVELLPVFNRTSSKQYRAPVPTADWTNPHSSMNRLYHPQFHSQSAAGGGLRHPAAIAQQQGDDEGANRTGGGE